MSAIQPRQFDGQPLILKTTYDGAEDDCTIHCTGDLVGRIRRSDLAGGAESWLWTVTGPYLPEALRPGDGLCSGLEEAKAAFRAKFDAWLTWAQEQAGPVPWHGTLI